MPMTLSAPLNPYGPLCTVTPCLQQVAGSLNNNPVAQYAACVSMFGTPAISTV